MAIDHNIIDEKIQYDIDREATRISELSSSKFDIYKHLTGEDILRSDQSRIIEQPKLTNSPPR